jgi:molybdopterin-guanine dinucleotide biosynthesis protein A
VTPQFCAVLLAGGKSSRMGTDKAFLQIEAEPLWRRQLQLLEELEPARIFFAGPSHQEWSATGHEIIADAEPNVGPLAGLVAGLRASVTPFLLALAIDLPQMTVGCLRDLLARCEGERGVAPVTDRFEPLAAVYPKAALALAEDQLRSGNYSLQNFIRHGVDEGLMLSHPISTAQTALFLNLNTPADLLALRDSP